MYVKTRWNVNVLGIFSPNLSLVIVTVVAVLGCHLKQLDSPVLDFFFLIP